MLSNRNLRLLVGGQFISAIGDQFYLIALPWLALKTTGSAVIAGTLLAVAGIPRAAFMLVGGAISDRYSAKSLLVASNGIQAALMTTLGLAMLFRFTHLWFLYLLAFTTGLIDAFGLPAFNALLPRIVEDRQLESGNIYLQGANMASGAIGPALAGWFIALGATNGGFQSTLNGIGGAFFINALAFLVGISLFWRIQIGEEAVLGRNADDRLIDSIGLVIDHTRRDRQLRALFMLMAVFGLVLSGTIRIGFPLLAEANFSGGVRDYGNMSSAFGTGLLIGIVALKKLRAPAAATSGILVISLFSVVPIGLIVLALVPPIGVVLGAIFAMGGAFGYVTIFLLSWLQRRTPDHLLGRIMAVALFTTIGLAPLSQILMGYLLQLDLRASLLTVGSLVLFLLIATASRRDMWSLER